jgi:hypothetical protein
MACATIQLRRRLERGGISAVDAAYGWVKAFHIIAVVAWMAGMLHLPRSFVYHRAAAKGFQSIAMPSMRGANVDGSANFRQHGH